MQFEFHCTMPDLTQYLTEVIYFIAEENEVIFKKIHRTQQVWGCKWESLSSRAFWRASALTLGCQITACHGCIVPHLCIWQLLFTSQIKEYLGTHTHCGESAVSRAIWKNTYSFLLLFDFMSVSLPEKATFMWECGVAHACPSKTALSRQ